MPIRSSRFYNDPALGAAFENLAGAFAPPSGADAAGWARAEAEREAASRLTWLFNNPNDPTSSNRSALVGVQDYSQTPGGFAATDATNRRGQDVTAQTALAANAATNAATRYGYDLNAQTSRANNDADNARAVEQTRITSLGGLFGPVAEGAVRPEIPGNIASQFGVEGPIAPAEGRQKPMTTDEVAAAAMSAMPMAEQQQFVRDKFAPTETQVQGQERRDLRQRGRLSDDDLVNDVLSAMPVETVVGSDGATPEIVTRRDAIGRRPYNAPGAQAKPTNALAVLPDGSRVPAVQGQDGRWKHAQTGADLPNEIQVFDLPKPQGSAADIGLGPTTANTTSANNQEAEITRTLGALDVYENLVTDNPGAIGLAGLVRGTAQNVVATTGDLVRSFGTDAPGIESAAQDIRAGLDAIAPEVFDPSIPEAQFIQSTLAYALVRSENPSGEVSRQAYDDALRRVQGGGILANSQSAKAAIGAQRRLLQNQLEGVRALRNPGTGRTDTSFVQPPGAPARAPASPAGDAAAVERWERGPDGAMRKVVQ